MAPRPIRSSVLCSIGFSPIRSPTSEAVLATADEQTRLLRLRTLRSAEATRPIPVTRGVAGHFASLVIAMRRAGTAKLKVQDAWIAATALDHEAEVWTQDGDFDEVPGLEVVRL